jgi:hypothetical protein
MRCCIGVRRCVHWSIRWLPCQARCVAAPGISSGMLPADVHLVGLGWVPVLFHDSGNGLPFPPCLLHGGLEWVGRQCL